MDIASRPFITAPPETQCIADSTFRYNTELQKTEDSIVYPHVITGQLSSK
jgi:hypothetical protein